MRKFFYEIRIKSDYKPRNYTFCPSPYDPYLAYYREEKNAMMFVANSSFYEAYCCGVELYQVPFQDDGIHPDYDHEILAKSCYYNHDSVDNLVCIDSETFYNILKYEKL